MTRALLLRVYRLGVLILMAWAVRERHARGRETEDRSVRLEEVKELFPQAARLSGRREELHVLDREGRRLGTVLRSTPDSDAVRGYVGPTETLIAIGPDGRILAVRVRRSADSPEYVTDIVEDPEFLPRWRGLTLEEAESLLESEGVSGATVTSCAIAEGIARRLSRIRAGATPSSSPRFRIRDGAMIAGVVAAAALSFTSLRRNQRIRRSFQIVVIVGMGFLGGELVSQALLWGWAAQGLSWKIAPGMAFLAAAALLVPWSTGRGLYCGQLCPYGALQELLGRTVPWKARLPLSLKRGLRWVPFLLVVLAGVSALLGFPVALADLEPFAAFQPRSAGPACLAIAITGLAASLWVPQAYCKYGCPTGAVLGFVRSWGPADRFGRRDVAAGALLGLMLGMSLM